MSKSTIVLSIIVAILAVVVIGMAMQMNGYQLQSPIARNSAGSEAVAANLSFSGTKPVADNAVVEPEPAPAIAAAPNFQCKNTDWFDAAVNPAGTQIIDIALIGTEPCAATWRTANGSPVNAVCPAGWVCTFDVYNDIVRVYEGNGQIVSVRAATWRPGGTYCEILNGEVNFANSQSPTFQVKPADGSPTCN